ncbi:hypothetical protein [Aminipila luticellarii]|uniref:Uncharacterized protein n=1 Tax=Aminipila luticellarii TaxID=2507160 RepID=A0A410PWZ3_9FIRM|nr:hypothetical protein [Aminipila luticellarii]QAT43459.1 hypothetical protein EQM06_09650 [Aminipila luticellarii]
MNKHIEKATLKIIERMEKNRHEYNEAKEWLDDTGYDRYYKKMERLDAEYEELKNFINPEPEGATAAELIELDRLRRTLKDVKSKVFYMECDFPSSSHLIGLKDLLRDV